MACRTISLTIATCLSLLSVRTSAQDVPTECEQLLNVTRMSERTAWYNVEGAAFETLWTRPSPDETDLYQEWLTRGPGPAEVWSNTGTEVWSCLGDVLHLNRVDYDRPGLYGDTFDPPLPVFDLSASPGDRWTWVGTWTVELYGARADYPAAAELSVLPEEVVETSAGHFVTTPVQMDVRVGSAEELDHQLTLWLITTPVFTVVQRRVTSTVEGEPVVETWTIRGLSMGVEDEESADDGASEDAIPDGFGHLGLSSSPRGVIHIDDVSTGLQTPSRRIELEAGRHEVRIFYESLDLFSETQSVLIREGVNTNVFFRYRSEE